MVCSSTRPIAAAMSRCSCTQARVIWAASSASAVASSSRFVRSHAPRVRPRACGSPSTSRSNNLLVARLEVGRIGRAHGLRGEVHVVPISNRPERFEVGATLYVGDVPYEISSARLHQKHWLVHFEGVDDLNAAEALRGRLVTGDPLGDLPDGEVWVHELIGAEVRESSGARIGRVVAVEDNPAHELLVLDNNKLVPIVFITDQSDGLIVVDLPE